MNVQPLKRPSGASIGPCGIEIAEDSRHDCDGRSASIGPCGIEMLQGGPVDGRAVALQSDRVELKLLKTGGDIKNKDSFNRTVWN